MRDKTAQYKLRYLVIPEYVYSDASLTLSQVYVYGFINSYVGNKGFQFSNEHIAFVFGITTRSVSRAMTALEEKGYIKTSYRIRSGGGKVRLVKNTHFQARLDTDVQSEETQMSSQTRQECPVVYMKDNKGKIIKENNIKEKFFSLDDLTESVVREVSDKYSVAFPVVDGIRDELQLYCKSKGKTYVDYKAALMNWVRRRIDEKPELVRHKNNDPLVEFSLGRLNAQ